MNAPYPNDFEIACYPVRLNLPETNTVAMAAARRAIEWEFRDSVKLTRLRCRKVKALSGAGDNRIFVLDVGRGVDFDWTWEGAKAYRPVAGVETDDQQDHVEHDGFFVPAVEQPNQWSGKILQVNETAGHIYIDIGSSEQPPTTGSFLVEPFAFLEHLHAVYRQPSFEEIRDDLPSRLRAAAGGIHPLVDDYRKVGLPALQDWWRHSWSIIWGPPGTGKTFTIGRQTVGCLADQSERILIVSTTNRATDEVAKSVGVAAQATAAGLLAAGRLTRIGRSASSQTFREAGLLPMLRGTEVEVLTEIERLKRDVRRTDSSDQKAVLQKSIQDLRRQMKVRGLENFIDKRVRVVVCTAFQAMSFLQRPEVQKMLREGSAPFTTVFIDEAGLVSRVATAALSLLAARRVVLAGDPHQLAPISRISRILPTAQAQWIGTSGLGHLNHLDNVPTGVWPLIEQHRMHPEVCRVVSKFQYVGHLVTAPGVVDRESKLPACMQGQPRAIWYVLDNDTRDLAHLRAERGPGNRSWIRSATMRVLAKLFADEEFRAADGLFISPFLAQAQAVAKFLAVEAIDGWSASTVHSQQGAEAAIVLFDSVNAGSYGWSFDEWQRLVNVAISRAREAVIVLASRAEMEEPYLRPLTRHLAPRITDRRGGKLNWREVDVELPAGTIAGDNLQNPHLMGNQIAKRRQMRPVLSAEQERLCGLPLDGKPRLVRGVAGSGKTAVLAHWLFKTMQSLNDQPDARIWAVYANRSLHRLIGDAIDTAWQQECVDSPFPWNRVSLWHIKDVLEDMLPEFGLAIDAFGFDYDRAAAALLERAAARSSDEQPIAARCEAMFIDEAQDMGPNTLKLLSLLVRQTSEDQNSRSLHIFYDNAQNVYGRGVPKWSELGLDLRGRSTVMKESFRSTLPISELALNVLYSLQPPDADPEYKELTARGLVEPGDRGGKTWWHVRYNQIDGPPASFQQFNTRDEQFAAIGRLMLRLLRDDGVQPSDICLICNGKAIAAELERHLCQDMRKLGISLMLQTNKPFDRGRKVLLMTTPHSFKGYDAEVVILPAVDQFVAAGQRILASNLYVAMTRARSILAMYGLTGGSPASQRICDTIQDCLDRQGSRQYCDHGASVHDDLADLVDRLGHQHRDWLAALWKKHDVVQEPICDGDGRIMAEPLFWFDAGGTRYAFWSGDGASVEECRLEPIGVKPLNLGELP